MIPPEFTVGQRAWALVRSTGTTGSLAMLRKDTRGIPWLFAIVQMCLVDRESQRTRSEAPTLAKAMRAGSYLPTQRGTSSASLRTAAPDRRPHTAVGTR